MTRGIRFGLGFLCLMLAIALPYVSYWCLTGLWPTYKLILQHGGLPMIKHPITYYALFMRAVFVICGFFMLVEVFQPEGPRW